MSEDDEEFESASKVWEKLRLASLALLAFILILIFVVVFTAIGIYWSWQETQKYAPYCREDQYSCKQNGYCLNTNKLCNGISDCPDREDESTKFSCYNLNNPCPAGEIQCPQRGTCAKTITDCYNMHLCPNTTGTCVPSVQIALVDCESDVPINSSTIYFCGNRRVDGCILQRDVCNSIVNCPNFSDEVGCAPPRIIRPPVKSVYVFPGDNFNLYCVATGKPTPEIKWYFNIGQTFPGNCTAVSSSNGIGTLRCEKVDHSVEGKFTCQAVNKINSVFALPFCNVILQEYPNM